MNELILAVRPMSEQLFTVLLVVLVLKYVRPALVQAEHQPKTLPEATRCSSR